MLKLVQESQYQNAFSAYLLKKEEHEAMHVF